MKIAMIGLRGIPAKSGGVENVVEHLAPLLVKLGHDVTVYCRNPYCDKQPKTWKGVKLKYLPTINTKYTEAFSHSFLSTLDIIPKHYDIIHYHAMGNGLFSTIPKMLGKKTVVTLHGLDYEREKWGIAAKTYLKISEKMMDPDAIISVSKKIKDHYKKTYNKNIEFIPNGVDIKKPLPIKSLNRFNLKKDNYILFLSRIVPEKEVHTLIQAYKKLDTNIKLVIAGDATHTDEYLKEAKALAKENKNIIFTGPLYGKDKIEAFSNALFFVLPSTIEGMPIVLLEAMSFGLTPLVSDIKENLAVIEDVGFSFKVRDIKDLSKKLEYLIKNKSLVKNKGRSAKALVKKKYQWQRIAKQTLKLYKNVLDEN
jgi:glycosyltransferase involved in cell wall biosynthesis